MVETRGRKTGQPAWLTRFAENQLTWSQDASTTFYVVQEINGDDNFGQAVANNKTQIAQCDQGDIATGGGVQLAGRMPAGATPFSQAEIANHLNIVENQPLGGATGWFGRTHEVPHNTNPVGQKGWEIRTTVICADIA